MEDIQERDQNGLLTAWALAVDAIIDHGCDCGTDDPGSCLACLCEAAMRAERERVESLRQQLQEAREERHAFKEMWQSSQDAHKITKARAMKLGDQLSKSEMICSNLEDRAREVEAKLEEGTRTCLLDKSQWCSNAKGAGKRITKHSGITCAGKLGQMKPDD